MRSESDDCKDASTPPDDTLSGVGIWTGLVPVARESDDETDDDGTELADRIDRLFDRYRWFIDRIDTPRSRAQCERILSDPPEDVSARKLALVELSMHDTERAEVFLRKWRPDDPEDDDLELELFRRICAAQCNS